MTHLLIPLENLKDRPLLLMQLDKIGKQISLDESEMYDKAAVAAIDHGAIQFNTLQELSLFSSAYQQALKDLL